MKKKEGYYMGDFESMVIAAVVILLGLNVLCLLKLSQQRERIEALENEVIKLRNCEDKRTLRQTEKELNFLDQAAKR
jgi:cell division protein ZapA (FtsZ GTPase activity inhibitor)